MFSKKEKVLRFATGVVFIIFMVAILVSYRSGKDLDNSGNNIVPTITAEKSPIKIAPEEEGGLDIPFRETEIYSSVEESINEFENVIVNEVENIENLIKEKEELLKQVKENNKDMDSVINSIYAEKKEEIKTVEPVLKAKTVATSVVAKDYRVQLASLKATSDIDAAWERIKDKNSNELSALSLHKEKVETANGAFYRIQTSLISEVEARKICDIISPCLVVKNK